MCRRIHFASLLAVEHPSDTRKVPSSTLGACTETYTHDARRRSCRWAILKLCRETFLFLLGRCLLRSQSAFTCFIPIKIRRSLFLIISRLRSLCRLMRLLKGQGQR